jgi:hypothetical protein
MELIINYLKVYNFFLLNQMIFPGAPNSGVGETGRGFDAGLLFKPFII